MLDLLNYNQCYIVNVTTNNKYKVSFPMNQNYCLTLFSLKRSMPKIKGIQNIILFRGGINISKISESINIYKI